MCMYVYAPVFLLFIPVLTCFSPSVFHSSGFDHRCHPSSQPEPAAGERAHPPETLQQKSPADGLDQEK